MADFFRDCNSVQSQHVSPTLYPIVHKGGKERKTFTSLIQQHRHETFVYKAVAEAFSLIVMWSTSAGTAGVVVRRHLKFSRNYKPRSHFDNKCSQKLLLPSIHRTYYLSQNQYKSSGFMASSSIGSSTSSSLFSSSNTTEPTAGASPAHPPPRRLRP